MYAIFHSPHRRTNSTPLFVHFTQKTWSPAISQCAICTNLLNLQKTPCNPFLCVVQWLCQQGKSKSVQLLPFVRGKSPTRVSRTVSVRAVYLVNWIGNRPPDRRTGKRAATMFHVKHLARQVKRKRVTYCFTWNILRKELILWNFMKSSLSQRKTTSALCWQTVLISVSRAVHSTLSNQRT